MSRARIHVADLPRDASGALVLTLTGQRAASIAAQDRGDEAERRVDAYHQRSDVRARAVMVRRFSRKVGTGAATRVVTPQGPDFAGYLRAGATHVECEVKFVPDTRLDLVRLTDSQRDGLAACAAAGGVALVLCLAGPVVQLARWCAVPWADVAAALSAGRKSIPVAELLAREVRGGACYLEAPWLRPALANIHQPAGVR